MVQKSKEMDCIEVYDFNIFKYLKLVFNLMEQVKMATRVCNVKCPEKDFENCRKLDRTTNTIKMCPFFEAVAEGKYGTKNFYCSNPKAVS
jgi:hypothetical protein